MSLLRPLTHYYRIKFKLAKLRVHLLAPVGEMVLDVGSGDGPSPAADVLCDRFLEDTERHASLRLDRPFVIGDVEDLPFLDGAFGFVYCSHLLEHTRDPARAMAELQRVARRGYIEVPSEYLERSAKSTATHFWFVRVNDGELVFTPKPAGVLSPFLNDLFDHHLMYKDDLYTAFHWANFYRLFNIGYRWKGSIPHRIEGVSAKDDPSFSKGSEEIPSPELIRRMRQAACHAETGTRALLSVSGWIKRAIRRRSRRAKSFDLLRVVACPFCKGSLVPAADSRRLDCAPCRKGFPWLEGVPCLLKGAGVDLAESQSRP